MLVFVNTNKSRSVCNLSPSIECEARQRCPRPGFVISLATFFEHAHKKNQLKLNLLVKHRNKGSQKPNLVELETRQVRDISIHDRFHRLSGGQPPIQGGNRTVCARAATAVEAEARARPHAAKNNGRRRARHNLFPIGESGDNEWASVPCWPPAPSPPAAAASAHEVVESMRAAPLRREEARASPARIELLVRAVDPLHGSTASGPSLMHLQRTACTLLSHLTLPTLSESVVKGA